MNDKPRVLLIITLDTKEAEAKFIIQSLEEQGVEVCHLDASIRRTLDRSVAITPEDIAESIGKTMDEIRAIGHEGKCQALMVEGAIKCAQELHRKSPFSGIIGIGGSMGTTLATAVMRTFPFGLPKVMVSTMASGMTKPFVGTKDIVMFNSVCDISGLHTVGRSVFRNATVAVAAMARDYQPADFSEKPLVAMTTLGTTEKCAARVRKSLEEKGFEVVTFHTSGTGGAAMDEIVAERDVSVVVDISLIEINDQLHGGLCGAGPDRAKAALQKGVPTIFCPGNLDFLIAGPMEDAVRRFPGKRYHVHNAALTAVRSEAEEFRNVVEHMASLIREARGPVAFFVPLLGFSSHDSEEGHLHDPSLPPVFAEYLKKVMPKEVAMVEMPLHLNDPAFADALTDKVVEFHQRRQAAR